MYKIAKALHFVGLAMFLGSILGHITIGFVTGAKDHAQAMLFGRQAIEIATWSLTVPGLALLVATGLFMTVHGGLGFGRRRWLTVHQIIGALILLNAAFIGLSDITYLPVMCSPVTCSSCQASRQCAGSRFFSQKIAAVVSGGTCST
jgi:hypothetical protein